jgi:glycerol uptake facilitator-like aquaporin
MWVEFCGELLGTFMLIVLGNGVVANVVLEKVAAVAG